MELMFALLIFTCFLISLILAAKSYFISVKVMSIEEQNELNGLALRRVKAENETGLVKKARLIHVIDQDLLELGKKGLELKDITPKTSNTQSSSENVIYLNDAG